MNTGKLKKFVSALLSMTLTVTAASAVFTEKETVYAADKVVVSRIVTGENGKSYVEVDGKPFMYENVECMGTWLLKGFDASTIKGYKDPLPVSWLENVFEKTAQAGYNTVSTFFCWSDIEPEEGKYDWTLLDQYLAWADKYDVRLSLTWFGSDAGGGTRLPGYGAGWSCHVPAYLCDQAKYWNRRPVPEDALRHETRFRAIPGSTEGNYIKEREKAALIALTEHLRDNDKTHRMISLMINNESQNIPDSWHTELANAVKSVGYDFVLGQHMQKGQYKYREGYDFVGFDDYSTNLEYKLSFLNNSPTPLKACLETGGNANNLSSQVLSGITNGGWVQAWQLCDAYSDCNNLGMFETPDAVYPVQTNKVSEQAGQEYDTISKPDYITWKVGTPETLKYGAEKNRRLQLALRKAYWVVAQASEKEMLSFNLETDEPAANYSASKELNGHTFGFVSDGPDSVRKRGSNGMIAGKGDEYFCLSDTGTQVTFITDTEPKSAEYGHQNGYLKDESGTGDWVKEGEAEVKEVKAEDGTTTWAVTCEPEQVIRLVLDNKNVAPVFDSETYEKIIVKNTTVSGTAAAKDGNYSDTVTYSIGTQPKNGKAEVNTTSGKWSYTPNTDWCGEETFTIAASDGKGGESAVTVKITVREHSSVPVFDPAELTIEIPKDTVTGGKCEATDEDEGDTHTYAAKTEPSHGTLIITETGEWSYTPVKGYAGEDQFVIKVTDSYGDTADMTVKVTVNDAEAGTVANLALKDGVSIEASSSFRTNPAENAIDGNESTLWSPNGTKLPQTLTVDLGGIHELNAVKFHVAATTSFEWRYKIEGSKDSVSWEVLADREKAGAKPAGNSKVAELMKGEYRYIRWTVTGTTSTKDSVSTREFEIWGNEETISADAHEPVITTQPVNAEYTYGDTAEALSVAAEVDDGGLISYQWYKNTYASSEGASLIPGATDADYVPSMDLVGTTYYYCRVTNRNDNTAGIAEVSKNSEIAAITVKKADGTATVAIDGWTYGEEAADPVPVSETNGIENVTYLYKVKDADDSTYVEEVPSEIGNYTLKAVFAATDFYNEVTATADFSIVEAPSSEKILERIEVTAPAKTEYEYGTELDMTGFQVTAVYSDGSVDDVTGEVDLEGYDANQTGEQTVRVIYGDKTGEFKVTVKEKAEEPSEKILERIEVTAPAKTEYEYGTELDITGMLVTAVYNDGTTEDVTEKVTIEGYNSSKSGEQKITVTYEGKTGGFIVIVKENPEEPIERKLERIEVTAPAKTEYEYGIELDMTGFQVTAVYSDGSVDDVTGEVELEGYDANQTGEQTVRVIYGDKTGEFKVTVKEKAEEPSEKILERIEVTAPAKTEYEYGTELDITGMLVTAVYNDGTTEDVTEKVTIEGYNSSKSGEQKITVTYEGKTDEFIVIVKENPGEPIERKLERIEVTAPSKTEYEYGTELDMTGFQVTAVYSDGTTEDVTDKADLAGYDKNKAGEQKITVTYEGKTGEFIVQVKENSEKPGDKKGEVENITKPENNVLSGVLPNDEELNYVLTEDDRNAIENGEQIKIELVVNDITESISSEDKKLITDVLADELRRYTEGVCLDLSLIKTVGETESKVTETADELTIQFTLPDNLLNTDKNITRTYKIIRIHNGEVSILDTQVEGSTLIFKTDRFSTYALVYNDTVSESQDNKPNQSGGNKDSNVENNGTSVAGNHISSSPKTGDAQNILFIICVMLFALSISILTMIYRHKKVR